MTTALQRLQYFDARIAMPESGRSPNTFSCPSRVDWNSEHASAS